MTRHKVPYYMCSLLDSCYTDTKQHCKNSSHMHARTHARTHTHTHTYSRFTALWILSGTTRMSRYQKKHSPTHTIVDINHPLTASSTSYDPWHPPCSMYVPDSLFPQSLSKFSLVYLLAWHSPLHTPYISSPNHCLLFAAHAHTIATYSLAQIPT